MVADVRGALADITKGLIGLGLSPGDAEGIIHRRSAGRLSDEKSLALVGFDADAVQAQVFASPRPVTIQGASSTLREWDVDLQRGKTLGNDAVVLFAGGGQAVVLALSDHALKVRRTLEEVFDKLTARSPRTTAHVVLSPRELAEGPSPARGPQIPDALARRLGWSPKSGEGFGAWMALLSLAMRGEKGAPSARPFLDRETTEPRCEECAERPRLLRGRRCERCQQYRERGGGDNSAWGRAHSFDEVLGERVRKTNGNAAGTDEEVLRERHLAFLRLDGRGIGAQLEKLRTIAQYTAVSLALRRAFEVHDLTTAFGVPKGRYQIPIAGGDDLLLVLPARWQPAEQGETADAFTLCQKLLAHVEGAFGGADLTEPFGDDPGLLKDVRKLGAGAGLVITSGMPASFCFDYAGELVTSAKNAIEGEVRSAVDFAVLRGGSPLANSLRELRRRSVLKLDLGPNLSGDVQPTRCPYTLADFGALLDRTRLLANAPRSALHALHAAMREPTTGMLAVRYQIARHPGLRSALVDGAGSVPHHDLGPWVLAPLGSTGGRGDASWATALPDLLDAWPFVTATKTETEEVGA